MSHEVGLVMLFGRGSVGGVGGVGGCWGVGGCKLGS